MPPPAARPASSRLVSAPLFAKRAFAASSRSWRLRSASARGFRAAGAPASVRVVGAGDSATRQIPLAKRRVPPYITGGELSFNQVRTGFQAEDPADPPTIGDGDRKMPDS